MAFQRRESRARGVEDASVITDARLSRSEDVSRREFRYVVTMVFRTLCFVSLLVVPGIWRWVVLAGAAFLPPVAVLLANASDNRSIPVARTEPASAAIGELTSGHVIPGEVEET